MNNEIGIYTFRVLLNHKKNEILSFGTTWMDLEDVTLSEIRQAQNDK
jgi:hypothetical protein